jgi:hypothetical protein
MAWVNIDFNHGNQTVVSNSLAKLFPGTRVYFNTKTGIDDGRRKPDEVHMRSRMPRAKRKPVLDESDRAGHYASDNIRLFRFDPEVSPMSG